MKSLFHRLMGVTAALAVAVAINGSVAVYTAAAQSGPSPSVAAPLNTAPVKALQEALNKQGIAVKTDGTLNGETRAAIRKYQSEHHLPVTGEPDKATLDKLGVSAQRSEFAPTDRVAKSTGQGTMGGGMKPGSGTMGQGMPKQ